MKTEMDNLSHLKPDVDYSQIPSIQQKRILTFVNHFIMDTVTYLNDFCQSCESRFMDFEYKMQKVEASLLILEAQLSSIPGFESPDNQNKLSDTPVSANIDQPSTEVYTSSPIVSEDLKVTNDTEIEVIENNHESGPKASDDPRYSKFFKMLKFGVQEEAVKLKMQSEGINPNILDKPDAVIPESEETQ